MKKTKLKLNMERVYVTPLDPKRPNATNSSACGACSCEQHCEQVR